jgi:hypothetical protein
MVNMKKAGRMITVRKSCLCLLLIIFLYSFTGCGADKDVAERRNFMIPKTSELPRNSLYKEKSKKKTNKPSQKKKKKTKSLF